MATVSNQLTKQTTMEKTLLTALTHLILHFLFNKRAFYYGKNLRNHDLLKGGNSLVPSCNVILIQCNAILIHLKNQLTRFILAEYVT